MVRTLLGIVLILLCTPGVGFAQIQPSVPLPINRVCELRYDGKSFTYWESFPRTELKAEKRIDALHAMAAFGVRGYAKEATAAIVELLKEYDNDDAAFQFDPNAPEKGSPDHRVLSVARWALRKIGPETSPVLLAHLDHKAVRQFAADFFAQCRYPHYLMTITESSVPLLVQWMQSKDDETRHLAIAILGQAITYEPKGKKDKSYQAIFLESVAKEKREKVIVDALAQGLFHGENPTGEAAALLLGIMGSQAKSAVSELVRAELRDNTVGWAARDALAKIKPTNAERVPGLVLELKGYWKANAAMKLREMGTDAKMAVADLLTDIRKPLDKTEYSAREYISERMAMVTAYVKIAGPKEALPVIVELLENSQGPGIEQELVKLYLKLEQDSTRVVSVLSKSLQRNWDEKQRKAMTFEEVRQLHQFLAAVPALRNEVVLALGAQGQNATSAVPLLLQEFDRSDASVKSAILVTLGKIGPSAKEALPFLCKLLQSDDANLRQLTTQAIAAITKK